MRKATYEDRFGMTEEDFQLIVLHDNIKTQYCKDNKINLIRIPYWEYDNIENILITQIKNFNDQAKAVGSSDSKWKVSLK